MPESRPIAPEVADTAWLALQEANNLFQNISEARDKLESVQRVASFALDGIIIQDYVLQDLEVRYSESVASQEVYFEIADPVLRSPNNPFGAHSERTVDYAPGPLSISSRICDRVQLKTFAQLRGHDHHIGSFAYNVLDRSVQDLRDIDAQTYFHSPETMGRVLRLITYRTNGDNLKEGFDKEAIRHTVQEWTRRKISVRGLGPRLRSFLADYSNHMFPDEDPLPVTYQPRPRLEAQNDLQEPSAETLLLDTVTLSGDMQELKVITADSLRRHALATAENKYRIPQFSRFIASLMKLFAPDVRFPADSIGPYVANNWLVYMGRQKNASEWGIMPDKFREIIGSLEQTSRGYEPTIYTDICRQFVRSYLDELELVVPSLSKDAS